MASCADSPNRADSYAEVNDSTLIRNSRFFNLIQEHYRCIERTLLPPSFSHQSSHVSIPQCGRFLRIFIRIRRSNRAAASSPYSFASRSNCGVRRGSCRPTPSVPVNATHGVAFVTDTSRCQYSEPPTSAFQKPQNCHERRRAQSALMSGVVVDNIPARKSSPRLHTEENDSRKCLPECLLQESDQKLRAPARTREIGLHPRI